MRVSMGQTFEARWLTMVLTALLAITWLVAGGVVAVSDAAGSNLLTNPGFEDGTSGWGQSFGGSSYPGTEFEADSEVAFSGKSSLRIYSPNAQSRIGASQKIQVPCSGEYHLRVYVKAQGLDPGTSLGLIVRIQFKGADGITNVKDSLHVACSKTDTDWKLVEQSFTVTEDVKFLVVEPLLYFAAGEVWWDDFSLEPPMALSIQTAKAEGGGDVQTKSTTPAQAVVASKEAAEPASSGPSADVPRSSTPGPGTTGPGTPGPGTPSLIGDNPGFEAGLAGWSPWIPAGKPEIKVDTSVFHSGAASLRFVGNDTKDRASVGRTVEVLPGATCRIEAWVKTQDVTGYGVQVRIQFNKAGDPAQKTRPHLFLGPLKGTQDWTKLSQVFVVPEGTGSLSVELFLESASGTVWWDDIALVKDESVAFKIEKLQARVLPSGAVKLEWSVPVLFAEGCKYRIYRGVTPDFGTTDRAPVAIVEETSFIDRNTAGNSAYFYKVIGARPDGQSSPPSLVAGVSIKDAGPSQPPESAWADWVDNGVTVKWTLPEDTRARSIEIERRVTGGDGGWDLLSMLPGWVEQYVDTALPEGVEPGALRYRITVIDPDGQEAEPLEFGAGGYISRVPLPPGADRHPFLFITKPQIDELKREAEANVALRVAINSSILEPARKALVTLGEDLRPDKVTLPPKNDNSAHARLAGLARDAALGYAFEGNSKMAQAALAVLVAYADAYKSYPLQLSYDGRVTTQTLDESPWLINLVWAYDLIWDSGLFTEAERRHVEEDLFREAVKVIDRYDKHLSNWQAWHNAAMGAVGFLLNDEALIKEVLSGPQGFVHHIGEGIRGDGIWWEQSIGYHGFTRMALTYLAEMAYHRGYDLYNFTSNGKSLKLMFDGPFYHAFSDRKHSVIGNAGYNSALGFDWTYGIAAARYGDPKYGWLFAQTFGQASSAGIPFAFYARAIYALEKPEEFAVGTGNFGPAGRNLLGSTLMADTGMVVLRGSVEAAGGPEISMVYKPHGTTIGHQAADNLTIILNGKGKTWAPGPGSYDYNKPEQGSWYKQTVARNGVVVDETSQYPQGLGQAIFASDGGDRSSSGRLLDFIALPSVQFASAATSNVYDGVSLERSVLVASPYVLDLYRVRSGEAHQYDWVVHVDGQESGESLKLEPLAGNLGTRAGYEHISDLRQGVTDGTWQANWKDGEQGFTLIMLGAPGTKVFRGTGLGPNVTRQPLLIARRNAKETEFISIMEPHEGEPSVKAIEPVSVSGKGSSAVKIQRKDGTDLFAWNRDTLGGASFEGGIERSLLPGGLAYAGSCAFFMGGGNAHADACAPIQAMLLVDGTSISSEDLSLTTSGMSTIGIERLGDSETILVNASSGPRRVEVVLKGTGEAAIELFSLSQDGSRQRVEPETISREPSGALRVVLYAQPGGVYYIMEVGPDVTQQS